MRSEAFPLTRDLVLIGGGHTHALVLRRWGMDPLPGVRVTVIDPGPTTAYSGMLPGFVAGHYDREDLAIDLVRLARFAGARLVLGAAQGLDLAARTVRVAGRPPVAFDIASLDIGITSDLPDLPGFAEHAQPAKPLGPFARRWAAFRDAPGARPPVAVLGGGAAGAELAMAMAHALRGRGGAVRLIDRSRILTEFNPTARRLLRAALDDCGIEVIENAPVAAVAADHVALQDGRRIPSGFTVGAAGASPQGWLSGTGLALQDGFVAVDRYLRSSDPAVFAAGDCAHLTHAPRPKAGVYAVREAPVLYDNLRAVLSGQGQGQPGSVGARAPRATSGSPVRAKTPASDRAIGKAEGHPQPAAAGRAEGEAPSLALRAYWPQNRYLKLVSLGARRALAERFGTALRGAPLWHLKDRIDRRFMQRLGDLPAMPAPALPRAAAAGLRETLGAAPMCGGCGAKVGRGALRAVLATLPQPARADVEHLPGDDAALLRTGGALQVMTTDHLRALTEDPVVMTRIAAVHALGDIWAMGAAPQAATAMLILPRMSPELQRRTLAEIMAAAAEVFGAAGAAIVGGHSSMGPELTIGFSVTGLCERAPITLGGGRPGDALILTKPLGSGVIMAAEMRGRAPGHVVAAALQAMTRPQGTAARLLAGAHAMTDVTGFGLAGHLMGICEASALAAEVDLAAVPMLEGAEALAAAGIRSTLHADNRAGAGPVDAPEDPRADLLFDPQTAGGLLAAVAAREAPALLAALRAEGHEAALIGRLVQGPPRLRVR